MDTITPTSADGPATSPADVELLTIEEAATRLRITPDAVRKRLRRGKLTGEKGADGTWTGIWWTPDVAAGVREDPATDAPDLSALTVQVAELRQQVTDLETARDRAYRQVDDLAAVRDTLLDVMRRQQETTLAMLAAVREDSAARVRALEAERDQVKALLPPTPPPRRGWWARLFGK